MTLLPEQVAGTQIAWDQHYALKFNERARGPHIFNVGAAVRRADGVLGLVVQRTALYAWINWQDGTRTEVAQFDCGVTVQPRLI